MRTFWKIFSLTLEKQYLIKTPHSALPAPPSPTGEGIVRLTANSRF